MIAISTLDEENVRWQYILHLFISVLHLYIDMLYAYFCHYMVYSR